MELCVWFTFAKYRSRKICGDEGGHRILIRREMDNLDTLDTIWAIGVVGNKNEGRALTVASRSDRSDIWESYVRNDSNHSCLIEGFRVPLRSPAKLKSH